MLDSLRDALRWMRSNKLRTAITMLSILITALLATTLAGLGLGVQKSYNAYAFGSTGFIQVIRYTPMSVQGKVYNQEPIWNSDLTALEQQHNPALTSEFIPMATGDGWVRHGNRKFLASVVGSTPSVLDYEDDNITKGTNFTWQQYQSGTRVVTLGPLITKVLFANPQDAIGSTVYIGRVGYKVVGLNDDNNLAFMPLSSARNDLFGGVNALNQIAVRLTDPLNRKAAIADLGKIMFAQRGLKNGDDDHRDFKIDDSPLNTKYWGFAWTVMVWSLIGAFLIALLIGTLGLTNAMLSTVAERASEFEDRRKAGSHRFAIFGHVLTESVIIAAIAGVIGTGIGVVLTLIGIQYLPTLSDADYPFTPILSVAAVALGIGSSLLVGVLAGVFAALRASRMSPSAAAAPSNSSTSIGSTGTRRNPAKFAAS